MPGFNVFAPRSSPFGYMLSTGLHRSSEHYKDRLAVYKRNRLDDIQEPIPKRQKMANRRRSAPSRRRYALKSRRTYRRRRAIIPRPVPSLWPRQKLVKFSVVGTAAGTSGAGSLVTVVCKANSLSDPLASIGAELPLGLDQWAAMYKQYVVVGSRIRVDFHNGAASGGSFVAGVALKGDATTLTNHEAYMELPRVRYGMVTTDLDHRSTHMTYSGKRFERIRSWKEAEDFHGSFTTVPGDPTEVRYYHIFLHDLNEAEAITYEVLVRIDFTVLLFDSIIPARSSL